MSRVEKGGARFKPQVRPRAGVRPSTQAASSHPTGSPTASTIHSQPVSSSTQQHLQPVNAHSQTDPQGSGHGHVLPSSQHVSLYNHDDDDEEQEDGEGHIGVASTATTSRLPPVVAAKSSKMPSASSRKKTPKAILLPSAPSPSPSPPPTLAPALEKPTVSEPARQSGHHASDAPHAREEPAPAGSDPDARQSHAQVEVAAATSGVTHSQGAQQAKDHTTRVHDDASSAASPVAGPPSTSSSNDRSSHAQGPPSATRTSTSSSASRPQSFVRLPRTSGSTQIAPLLSRGRGPGGARTPSLSPAPAARPDRSSVIAITKPRPRAQLQAQAPAAPSANKLSSSTPVPESLRRESMGPPEIGSARKAREASILPDAGSSGATPANATATIQRASSRQRSESLIGDREAAAVASSPRETGSAKNGDSASAIGAPTSRNAEGNVPAALSTALRAPWEVQGVPTAQDGSGSDSGQTGAEASGSAPWDALVKENEMSDLPPTAQEGAPTRRGRGRSDKSAAVSSTAPDAAAVAAARPNLRSASKGSVEVELPLRRSGAILSGEGEAGGQQSEEREEGPSDDSAEEYFPSLSARRGRGRGRGGGRGGASTQSKTPGASPSAKAVSGGGKSGRKGKLKLPDDAPKKPTNAFMLFNIEQRAALSVELAGLSFKETAQKVGRLWSDLPAAEKGERMQGAKRELEEWKRNMAAWRRANPEWDDKMLEAERARGGANATDGETVDEDGPRAGSAGLAERKRKKAAATRGGRKRPARSETEAEGSQSESGTKRRKRRGEGSAGGKRPGVSDDEAAYDAELLAVDGNERLLQVHQGTTMDQLSRPEVRMGRAGPRTFALRRTYKEMRSEGRKGLQERRLLAARKDKGLLDEADREEERRSRLPRPVVRDGSDAHGREAEVEEEEEVLDSDGEPVPTSSRAGSASPAPSGISFNSAQALRENQNSVQLRMSNGRFVLDESTLQVDRAAEYEDEDRVVVEESERDKFITSASFTNRPRGHQRWNKEETIAFYAAVSQWGTDFEMIARMFVNRTRREIKLKWTSEEKRNPHMIDAAFKRRMPVDLKRYGEVAGVDLSGPPPIIKARTPPPSVGLPAFLQKNRKKKEGEEEEEEEGDEGEAGQDEREVGPNGEEIVEEGEEPVDAKFGHVQARSKRNVSATPSLGAATQSGAGSSAGGSDVEAVTAEEGEEEEEEEEEGEEEQLPDASSLLDRKRRTSNASESAPPGRPRAGSTVSATSASAASRKRAGSTSVAVGSAVQQGKTRRSEAEKKRVQRDSRQEREKRHRRTVPDVGEEEVVGTLDPPARRQNPRRG